MSYEEEDTYYAADSSEFVFFLSYEEEDTCHMRRRIHVI